MKQFTFKSKEDWLAFRRGYIGGSDASSVVGMNPFRSAYTLWAEKTGRVKEFEGNLATDVGSYLEEFVAQEFAERMGKKVRKNNRSLVNEEYPFAMADVDREIVGEDALLECKFTDSINLKRFHNGIDFPDIYYCQCVHYLAVTGKQRIYLAVLIGNKDFKIYVLERDEGEIAALMDAEKAFWEGYVLTDEAPAPDGSYSSTETVNEISPEHTNVEDVVDLTAIKSEVLLFLDIKKQIKDLETRAAEIQNAIKVMMGESKYGACKGAKVTLSDRATSSFDKELLKEKTGYDYSEFVKTTGKSITCLIKEVKEDG